MCGGERELATRERRDCPGGGTMGIQRARSHQKRHLELATEQYPSVDKFNFSTVLRVAFNESSSALSATMLQNARARQAKKWGMGGANGHPVAQQKNAYLSYAATSQWRAGFVR